LVSSNIRNTSSYCTSEPHWFFFLLPNYNCPLRCYCTEQSLATMHMHKEWWYDWWSQESKIIAGSALWNRNRLFGAEWTIDWWEQAPYLSELGNGDWWWHCTALHRSYRCRT
jgi:hypothetical protein